MRWSTGKKVGIFGGSGLLLFLLIFYFANLQPVKAGWEAVQIHRPYIFGRAHVDSDPLPVGRHFVWPSTYLKAYEIRPLTKAEPFVDLTASDNVAVDFRVHFVFVQLQGKTPVLHERFSQKWYQNKVKEPLRTIVRNEARTRTSIQLRVNTAIILESQETIKTKVSEYLVKEGIDVRLTQVVIGKVVPPDEVLKESARTAAQKQREQTESARAAAEVIREDAEMKKAIADSAYMNKMKMSPSQYIQLRTIEMVKDKEGVTIILNAGSGNVKPVLDVSRR